MTHPFRKHKPHTASLLAFASLSALFACTPPQQREDKPPRSQAVSPAPTASTPSTAPRPAPIPADDSKTQTSGHCPSFAPPSRIGTIDQPQLNELSGLTSSRRDPEFFWTHNDSGGAPQLYALDAEARLRGTVELPVTAVDWEDIAAAHSPSGTPQLYIADSGDNQSKRSHVIIHRITEPQLKGEVTNLRLRPRDVESMRLKYPDGPHDAEALFVDPLDGSLYLLTKPRLGWAQLYRAPEFKAEATLEAGPRLTPFKTSQALHWVTAADISRDGRWIALRTYNQLALFSRPSGMSIAEALSTPACLLNSPDEKQGEAVAFGSTAAAPGAPPSLLTVSEGLPSALFRLAPLPRQPQK